MAKSKRQKTYESAGIMIGQGNNWYCPVPPKLRKKDVLRKMIQDSKHKR